MNTKFEIVLKMGTEAALSDETTQQIASNVSAMFNKYNKIMDALEEERLERLSLFNPGV